MTSGLVDLQRQIVAEKVDRGVNIDKTSDGFDNDTPVMAAITQFGYPKVINLLLSANASLDKPNNDQMLQADHPLGNPRIYFLRVSEQYHSSSRNGVSLNSMKMTILLQSLARLRMPRQCCRYKTPRFQNLSISLQM